MTTPAPVPPSVTIVGGGIGGLTLANALQRVGIGFELYEQAPRLTEVGAAIGLTQGVLELFDALDLGAELRARGTPVHYLCLPDKQLHARRRIRTRYEAFCVHRAELIEVLKSRLPAERVHLSKRVVDVRSLPDSAEVDFADGTSISSPLVIAADGINSVIRQRLFPELSIRHIDQTIWRGKSTIDVPEVMRDAYVEIWDERLRFLTVPYGESIFWLAVKAAPPGGRDDPDTVIDELLGVFKNFHPVVRELIARSKDRILRNDMADLGTEPRPWHHGRVVFLGDSIHATTPNLAQGGCQAIEDAVCLALCLDSIPDDMQKAAVTYQRLRQKRVDFIVRTSWVMGRAAHSKNPLVHHPYRLMLQRAPAAFIHRQERYLNDLSYLGRVDVRGLIPARA